MGLLQRSMSMRKHLVTMGHNPFQNYERVPSIGHRGAIRAPEWPKTNFEAAIKSGKVLRGSGLWGPEETYVMRQNLWNRLNMKRPQRNVPSLEECQLHYELEVAIAWWCLGLCIFLQPLCFWAMRYSASHEAMPWYMPRRDGTRGCGPFLWVMD